MASVPPLQEVRRDTQGMSTSDAGLQFIFHHEALRGVTEHLHWPGGSSGVTLGAGYDMKDRDKTQIAIDLKWIGVPPDVADKASSGAGLTRDTASDFADDHEELLSLTEAQQVNLLKKVVPHYEAIVRRNLNAKLLQHEFDALVSFAYDPAVPSSPSLMHSKRVTRSKPCKRCSRASSLGTRKVLAS